MEAADILADIKHGTAGTLRPVSPAALTRRGRNSHTKKDVRATQRGLDCMPLDTWDDKSSGDDYDYDYGEDDDDYGCIQVDTPAAGENASFLTADSDKTKRSMEEEVAMVVLDLGGDREMDDDIIYYQQPAALPSVSRTTIIKTTTISPATLSIPPLV